MHILIVLIFAISCQLSAISPAYAGAAACDPDCMKCHTLSNEEVKNVLAKIKAPDAKILKIQISPVRGLWEISVDNKGQIGLFYLDFSKKHLVSGKIIEVDAAIDKTGERLKELNKDKRIDLSKIPLKDALILGDKKARIKVIVFTDPDCPFCGKLHAELKKALEERKDIAFYIKLFPLVKLHPDAFWKSKSIICNKSLKLLEDNFEKKTIPRPSCETDVIDNNIKLAASLGISGTPALIFSDGSVHSGYLEAEDLLRKIDSTKKKRNGK